MKIADLGPLTREPQIPTWQVSAPITIPYFDGKPMRVILDELKPAQYPAAEKALTAFLQRTPADRLRATPRVFALYHEVCATFGEPDPEFEIKTDTDLWSAIDPDDLVLTTGPHDDGAIYVQLLAECSWDMEHGLQLVYREGVELTRVSEQDGSVNDDPDPPEPTPAPSRPWWKLW